MRHPGFAERFISAQDGLELYYRDYQPHEQTGITLLCLAGLTRSSRDFHGIGLYGRAEGHRVICPDYRGRGRSAYDPKPENYRPETYINDIRHILTAAGAGPVFVIGTSLGGILATVLSVAVPCAVRGVVVNDVGPEMDPDGISNIIDYVARSKSWGNIADATAYMKETFPNLPADTEEHWALITEATYAQDDQGLWVPNWDAKIAEPLRGATGPDRDLWPFYKALGNRPSLFLRGALSDVLSVETFQAMQAAMPQHDYLTVEGVGHAPSYFHEAVLPRIDQAIQRAQTF